MTDILHRDALEARIRLERFQRRCLWWTVIILLLLTPLLEAV